MIGPVEPTGEEGTTGSTTWCSTSCCSWGCCGCWSSDTDGGDNAKPQQAKPLVNPPGGQRGVPRSPSRLGDSSKSPGVSPVNTPRSMPSLAIFLSHPSWASGSRRSKFWPRRADPHTRVTTWSQPNKPTIRGNTSLSPCVEYPRTAYTDLNGLWLLGAFGDALSGECIELKT